MSRLWLITGGAAALAREISDRGGVAACSSFPVCAAAPVVGRKWRSKRLTAVSYVTHV
jgi:hypothetical protein